MDSSNCSALFLTGKVSEERDAIVGGEALKAVAALCLRCAQPNRKTKDTCVEIIETVRK